MNNLVDPVKILLCGDHNVGKTSIARRLASMKFPHLYSPTSGLNDLEFQAELKHNATIQISVLDVGADVFIQQGSGYIGLLWMDVDGVIIVVDGSKSNVVSEAHNWVEHIAKQTSSHTKVFLVIHKADCLSEQTLGALNQIDNWIKRAEIESWALTVGHQDLGDLVLSRGYSMQQKAPADVLRNLVLNILLKRQSNFCKLLPVPFKIEFQKWTTYDYEDLDRYLSSSNR